MAQQEYILQLQNVVKRFGGITASNDITINVPRGSIYGMWSDVGPKYIRKYEADGSKYNEKCLDCGACEAICPQQIEIRRIFQEGCEALRSRR